jgi:hypothetical protein
MNLFFLFLSANFVAAFLGGGRRTFVPTYKNSSPPTPTPPPNNFIFENFNKKFLENIGGEPKSAAITIKPLNSGYLKTTIFNIPPFIKKCRITELLGDQKTQMLNIVIYPNNSAPVLTFDIVQFLPNASICFVNFYDVCPNDALIFNKLKKKWETGTLTVINTHLMRFLASWLPKIGNAAAAAAAEKNIFLYFNIKSPAEMNHVYEAAQDIINNYTNLVYYKSVTTDPDHTVFDNTRRNIEKKFVYTKFMDENQINDYMDSVFENSRKP